MQPNMGDNGFFWWFGTVVDREGDPEQLGRVKVKIFNVHAEDADEEFIQWAMVGQSPTSAAHEGKGQAPLGLVNGSMVFGFFMDGESKQIPAVLSVFSGKPNGVNDLSKLSLGENIIQKGELDDEPESPFKAKYPYNKVNVTESGHIFEIDDTPGAERIHQYHKSGTYHEIHPDGTDVVKIVGDSFDLTVKDKTVYVGGDVKITVNGSADITIEKDFKLTSKGSIFIKSPDITIEEA